MLSTWMGPSWWCRMLIYMVVVFNTREQTEQRKKDESIHLFQCWFVWVRCFYWRFEHRALFLEVYYLRYCGFFPNWSGFLPSVFLLGIPATRGCNGHDYGSLDVLKFYFVLFYFIYFMLFLIILYYFIF